MSSFILNIPVCLYKQVKGKKRTQRMMGDVCLLLILHILIYALLRINFCFGFDKKMESSAQLSVH